MYLLFKNNKGITPKQFYEMDVGEQLLLNAFVNIEKKERTKEVKDTQAMPVVII